mmetsp:Transcript_66771/g.169263  ORF Transcript_66771/g.169263 Transcript_66771/m.169263 type:complete len:736 (-) Transcript_66771:108-2315(-)
MVERLGSFRQGAAVSMQRAKGLLGWQGNEHGTLADEDDDPTREAAARAQQPTWPAPQTGPPQEVQPPASSSETPWDQAACIRAKLQQELKREGPVGSPRKILRSQSNLSASGSVQDCLAAAGAPVGNGGGEGSSQRERSEKRRQRRRRPGISDGLDSAEDPFGQLDGFSSGAPTPNLPAATPWGNAQPPPIPMSPLLAGATPLADFQANQGWLAGMGSTSRTAAQSAAVPSAAPWVGAPPSPAPAAATASATLLGGSTERAVSEGFAPKVDAPESPKRAAPAAPGLFDEAILAALSALPQQSLVDVLRRLQQARAGDVALALGTREASAVADAREALSPAKPEARLSGAAMAQVASPQHAHLHGAAVSPLKLQDPPPDEHALGPGSALPRGASNSELEPEHQGRPAEVSTPMAPAVGTMAASPAGASWHAAPLSPMPQAASPGPVLNDVFAGQGWPLAAVSSNHGSPPPGRELSMDAAVPCPAQPYADGMPAPPAESLGAGGHPHAAVLGQPVAPPPPPSQTVSQALAAMPSSPLQPAMMARTASWSGGAGAACGSASAPGSAAATQQQAFVTTASTPQPAAATAMAWPTMGDWPAHSEAPAAPVATWPGDIPSSAASPSMAHATPQGVAASAAPTWPSTGGSSAASPMSSPAAMAAVPASPSMGWGWPAPGSPGNVAAVVAEAADAASAPGVGPAWPDTGGAAATAAAWPASSGAWPPAPPHSGGATGTGGWPS